MPAAGCGKRVTQASDDIAGGVYHGNIPRLFVGQSDENMLEV